VGVGFGAEATGTVAARTEASIARNGRAAAPALPAGGRVATIPSGAWSTPTELVVAEYFSLDGAKGFGREFVGGDGCIGCFQSASTAEWGRSVSARGGAGFRSGSGFQWDGRYWARTSDLLLVRQAL
jgi:hypothetical protein